VSVWRLNRRARSGRDDSNERLELKRESRQLGLSGFFFTIRLICLSRPLHMHCKQHAACSKRQPLRNSRRWVSFVGCRCMVCLTHPQPLSRLSESEAANKMLSNKPRGRLGLPSAEAHDMSLQHAQHHARRSLSSRPHIRMPGHRRHNAVASNSVR